MDKIYLPIFKRRIKMDLFKILRFGLLSVTLAALSAISCKKTETPADPCASVICSNGGYCASGTCQCPTGYTGQFCQTQRTPTAIVIKSITITKFSTTNASGVAWDIGSNPDIYPTISVGSTVLWDAPNYINNAVPGTSYKFDLSPTFQITDMTATYTLGCWDYDTATANEYMGGVTGKMYSNVGGFPSTLDFTCSNCTVGFSIAVEYKF